jgi:putative transposase
MARFRILRPHLEEDVPLAHLARAQDLSLRTLQRWVRCYRRDGLAGLERRSRSDRGERTFPPDLVRLIEGLALHVPVQSVAAIHRRVVVVATERDWPIPGYGAVYGIVHRLHPALVTLARDGPKAYRERFDLLHRREAEAPNAIWQADHTQLDVWVRDDRDRPAKPWLTVIIDDYSRAIAGHRVGFAAPSALQTALALRDAISRKGDPHWHVCGIPAAFYTDHGSDFTSKHMEQVAADLKMVLVCSTVGQPRGRGRIERFFATVNQLFLCTLPGSAPPGSPPATEPVLTLAALDERLHHFVVEDDHHRVHGETGIAPQARWEAGGFLPRLPESAEQLDLLLLTVAKARRVHQDDIHFQGLRYLDLTLAAYVGETVTIRDDPRDLAEIRISHEGRFLCRAICPELAGTTIGLKDLVRARNARRRTLRAEITNHAKLVDLLISVHADAPSPPPSEEDAPSPPPSEEDAPPPAPRLKRYHNE